MRSRPLMGLLVVLMVGYLVVMGYQGVRFVRSGDAVSVVVGAVVLGLVAVGAYLVWREVAFSRTVATLGRELRAAGRWPTDGLSPLTTGQQRRDAAAALHKKRHREVEANPTDWGAWYRLGLAFDDAGDRKRARRATRHAITVYRGEVRQPAE
jgi:hypothetical protein